jgi:fibronectin type 3 domain-containing protein
MALNAEDPMRPMRSPRRLVALAALLGAVACRETVFVDGSPLPPPANFTYEIEASGDPARPAGILLSWDDNGDPALAEFRVYSRGSTGSSFGLRGSTTSNTFHDNGVPHLQYYVVAVDLDGSESAPSSVITVDERLALQRPSSLLSLSLNEAIHLRWSDNAYQSAPARFKLYRVYSTGYDLDQNLCDATWALEGTTVAPEFLAGALANGVPRCFGVSAVSSEGYESLWSPVRADTPRPDARNTLVFAYEESSAQSGFRFWQDLNADGRFQANELGLVVDGARTDIDFWVHRDPADSSLWIVPEFAGTRVRLYSSLPIGDLTEIDYAPATGYSRNMIEAVPTYGYVFEIVDGASLRYAGLRVTHVGRDYLIFDWSYQTDPGNPELSVHAGLPTVQVSGFEVTGAR